MLKALDNLSVRPLEAINLIRNVLKVDAVLIPMSEQPVDLVATDAQGNAVYGETDIDAMQTPPVSLGLSPEVPATREALEAVAEADLILIGPGSFYTSLMPVLLMEQMATALRRTPAPMIFIGNLGKETSPAGVMSVSEKLMIIEQVIGRRVIDAVVVGPATDVSGLQDRVVIQQQLEAGDIRYRHDRQLLHIALEKALQAITQ